MKKLILILSMVVIGLGASSQTIYKYHKNKSNIEVFVITGPGADTLLLIPTEELNTDLEYDNLWRMLEDAYFKGDSTMLDFVFMKANPKYGIYDNFVLKYENEVSMIVGITKTSPSATTKFDTGQLKTYDKFDVVLDKKVEEILK